ncbi:MAG: hypothetical protein ABFC89_13785 [Methanospirillum sp.]
MTEPADRSEVTPTFHAAGIETARAWTDANTGGARIGVDFASTRVGTDARITIPGPSADRATNDVALDPLVVDFSTSSVDVPTLIE